jgi:hypothetical protein
MSVWAQAVNTLGAGWVSIVAQCVVFRPNSGSVQKTLVPRPGPALLPGLEQGALPLCESLLADRARERLRQGFETARPDLLKLHRDKPVNS